MGEKETKPRVLLVDDEHAVWQLLGEKLGRSGFDWRGRSSGEDALDCLEQESIDAVVSDLKMPGMTGLELLAETQKRHPHVAFVMATGEDDIRVAVEAMKHGADDYLVKPFHLDAAVESVRRALRKKFMEAELERYRHQLEDMVERRTHQLQAAMKRIERAYDETLEALGAALDLRDTETAGHSRRVSLYCLEIARAVGCTNEQLKTIARGSYLHDIGKIGIPDSVLLKQGKLTAEEMAIMQTHVRIGYELLSRIPFLSSAAEIVLAHQERYDGAGYPQGLMGEEIPLGARIFAIADTLDAMTSDRPYRQALPFETARDEITRESGKQFDPDIVRVFLSLPEQTWERIRLQVASGRDRVSHLDTNREEGFLREMLVN
ncbi:MAG TPA: HD domain-containing phosphohydrolase [Terriglobia bacterium]|nr:HD domain-containing phosphohydrolase [Terriglobia bacterium]